MNKTAIAVSLILGAGLWATEAAAWGSANRFGLFETLILIVLLFLHSPHPWI